MKKISLFAAAVTALGLSGTALAEVFAFIQMPLTASQENVTLPAPAAAPNSTGYGRITALYDNVTKVLTYNVTWQLNTGSIPRTPSNNHLHGPGAVGTSAAIVIPFPDIPLTNSGRVSGVLTLTAAQETDLLAGNMYYNIHSTLAGGGEIRGQMIQNGTTATGDIFQNGVLLIGNVLVPGFPGIQAYGVDLTFNGSAFGATRITPLR